MLLIMGKAGFISSTVWQPSLSLKHSQASSTGTLNNRRFGFSFQEIWGEKVQLVLAQGLGVRGLVS